VLKLDHVRVRRGRFTLKADFRLDAGAITAVIGPSGGGKSTLLGIIAGFVAPDAGRVLWGTDELTSLPPARRPVAIAFQDNNLFPHLDAFANVALGLRPSMKLSPDEKARVKRALERVGLAGLERRRPAALSGGQQSRVVLARLLMQDRPILLLDEPFAALGPARRHEMLDLVAGLAGDTGATVLMVTHDPADALRIAGQTIFVDEGSVHAPRMTRALLDAPPGALAAYLGPA